MNYAEAILTIIEENNCPLYGLGDEFRLSERTLTLPVDKHTCLTLVEDMLQVRVLCEDLEREYEDQNETEHVFSCSGQGSGCTGVITVNYKMLSETDLKHQKEISIVASLLKGFPIFEHLNEYSLKELVSYLRLRKFTPEEIIIRKGDPGVRLYILVSGKVEVLGDDMVRIAYLKKGDVFGEMSLLSGDPVGATIRVVSPARVLFITGKNFRRVLNQFPSLQMYFAKLLAQRLRDTNMAMNAEYATGMKGRLSEMPPTELFQTLNQNQKTGMLILEVEGEEGKLGFREGALIHAQYKGLKDSEAFYALLKETKGRFRFIPGLEPEMAEAPEVGDFMWLLMEGLNKIDEAEGS